MDNQGEETPILYLYSDLVNLNPESANDFKDYFQVWGNHQQKPEERRHQLLKAAAF